MRATPKFIGIFAISGLLAVGAHTYAQRGDVADKEEQATHQDAATLAQKAPGVTFVEVTPQDFQETYQRLGVVEPSRVADVRARLSGYLAERLFEEGETVSQGQVLYRIERDTFEAEVQVQEAELADAKARLDLAKREYQRTLDLSKTGAVAQEQLDQAEIEQDRAEASVARAEAALREANLDLGYTEILAPISGIVGKAVRDRGDLVDDGSNSILTTITTVSPIYVTYGLSETDYLALQKDGNLALNEEVNYKVVLKNGEMFGETGRLNFKSPTFEASTGMLRIRVEFPNLQKSLLPNQFVKLVEDHGVKQDVLTVPKQSVIQSPAGSAVFVIDDQNTLQFRPVKVGDWRDESWEIASGLTAGERVMVEGLLKSKPGSPVSPTPYAPKEAIK